MTKLTIQPAETEQLLKMCTDIREEVFTREKGVPREIERDGYDAIGAGCIHILLLDDGVPAGALRYLTRDGTARLQRFCLLAAHRGRGAGRRALELLEEHCRSRGIGRIELDAKLEARAFYEKCGYLAVSDVFIEAGIPHIAMTKQL